jgi:hypothetical protein
MADIAGVLALNQVQFQQNLAIALTKQNFDAQKDVINMVTEAAGTGAQSLNSSGTGQIVNVDV